eukprot:TRINITY_DN5578_c0_g1_i1.p1 TRINITY_DN5578_c0_g1~~TRINITY_DN5578_c0_g1_i1.p1  ORF type:complete len:322 (+),score=126.49 TRINITY_DN5578_c0_g1_i1:46-1011(+)
MKSTNMMLQWARMKGLVCPPFTPYTASGEMNLSAVPEQIKIIGETGASAVFLGGTASEGASQTIEERVRIAEVYKAEFAKQKLDIKLIQHVGATSLEESRILAKEAERIGVDAIASVTPSFFRPANIEQMIKWLGGLAAAAPATPFYYYHIPVMTNLPATISIRKFLTEADGKIPTLHGIKYTSMNLCEYSDLCDVADGKYDIMAGLSEQMLAALAMGAKSAVSVPFNLLFAMKYYREILGHFNNGNMKEALRLQKEINELTFLLQHGGHGHAIPVMRAIYEMETGIDLGPCRLPLEPVTLSAAKAIEEKLNLLGFLKRAI